MPARSISADSTLNLFSQRAPTPVNNSTNNKDRKKHKDLHSSEKGEIRESICGFRGQVFFKNHTALRRLGFGEGVLCVIVCTILLPSC